MTGRLGAHGKRERRWVDVMQVRDHAAPTPRVVKRGSHHPGFTAGQRGHRIEEMGKAAQSFSKRGERLFVCGSAVTGAYRHALVGQRPDDARLRGGRERRAIFVSSSLRMLALS